MHTLKHVLRSLYSHARNPDPPRYPQSKIRLFIIVFYCVILFEATILITLLAVYPDNYLKHIFELFFSELGAPVTQFGAPNRLGAFIFSANMAGGVVGCAVFIPIIRNYFPIVQAGFYRKIRYFYLICIAMMAAGNIGVIVPYTVSWTLHVSGAFLCMIGMWIGWATFTLFNTHWLRFRTRVSLVVAVDIVICFVLLTEFLDIHQEFFQKPGQGLVFGLVVIWPYLHYRKGVRRGAFGIPPEEKGE